MELNMEPGEMSNFRRGHSKVYYESDNSSILNWDPGEGRTSFRSTKSMSDSECDNTLAAMTDFPDPILAKPVPLLNHHPVLPGRLNRSAELDDILEEELTEDEMSCMTNEVSSPSPQSSSSPESSFRFGLRDSSMRMSQNSQESSASSSGSPTGTRGPPQRPPVISKNKRDALTQSLSHKSQDSGFSDSADSNGPSDPSCSSVTKSRGNRRQEKHQDVRSEVVHETKTNSHNHKQYHVSKVYFYSVSDILTQNQNGQYESESTFCSRSDTDHVSVLDCQSRSVPQGHESPLPILSPPLSPPSAHKPYSILKNSNATSQCDTNAYYNALHLEHKPLPQVSPKIKPDHLQGGNKQQISPRIHTGTSSLGRNKARKSKVEKQHSISSGPQTAFPKTNGSLYESLNLGRPLVQNGNDKKVLIKPNFPPQSLPQSFSEVENLSNLSSASLNPDVSFGSVFLPSALNQNLDSFDDPLTARNESNYPNYYKHDDHLMMGLVRDPVNFWLQELGLVHEAECTIMLQSKPVSGVDTPDPYSNYHSSSNLNPQEKSNKSDSGQFWAGNSSKDTIRAIQTRAHSISALFAKLCKQLGHRAVISKLVPLVQGLSHQVHLFLVEYNKQNQSQINLPGYKPRNRSSKKHSIARDQVLEVPEEVLHVQRNLLQSCDKLKLTVSRHQSSGNSNSNQNLSEVVEVITHLGATFTKLIELMLSKEIKTSVEALENHFSKSHDLVLKSSIDTIITLALEGNHLCRLIAKHGGIRALLTICVDPKLRSVRVNAFRALGTVCCVLEGIMELEESGGIEIVSDTLRDAESSEEEKSEAAGLLAQVTSPWIENNTTIEGLGRHLGQLVESLTGLSRRTSSSETFLLSSAALANLTFMEPNVVILMKKHSTVKVLVGAVVKQTHTVSIYIQDQVAAVLANMAASSECRNEVVKHGGLSVLLRFLQSASPVKPKKPEDYAQMAATERVQQKCAIALSRLCNDSSIAEQVVKLNGLERLVQLCKDEQSRVYSDGVLVSCLAAVRKISQICGLKPFQELDAAELVEPRLLDSFLIFSSKNESFV